MSRKRVVVLLSGNGSTLQALIDQQPDSHYDIVGVFSNRPGVFGLQRAARANIPHCTINHQDFSDRGTFDQHMLQSIDQLNPDYVVLAGYMRILSSDFIRHFSGRLINIHPSLLPKHKGLNTYQNALALGDREHGTTVHFVTDELDSGAIILQASLPVHPVDTVQTLEQRVKAMEQKIYPLAVDCLCSGRLIGKDSVVWLDNHPLPKQGYLLQEKNLDQQCQRLSIKPSRA
ncbi:phosphoribosylglycinamide formyltransferase [Endozoicomonas gorgoniicola]|uniref:Phosphoribosylglycinamide formyltransferase n=1 Tax=Endozoicomonas gorgoniicola TaxID=1234144 RepID=A0ABT3MX36_9GAMM|nr:phosphoribosylglycinamide formyltransferase [Endozoicomonas gorgoniicola]MCW7553544.1 phosphoribosylglycinamide formyltransferase [Endozoicomonas gorgoniicola]